MSDKNDTVRVLGMIMKDCEDDVRNFEGKAFTGKTVSAYFGIIEAKIYTLAKIMKKHIEEDCK